ncbi:SMC domain-containing protein [Psychromonas sp. CNPT3]|uniref:ATP-dependent nuclease n=1 Tax=Psychromonas sp. CNPT3 TaxID=314282 RepID=UPI0002C06EEE|nr:AAA family ATPase [Psychromonas sp. CNPT3]AGH81801.1 SMC domain-containing protein [Psychromonas sp. CNPT3]
MYISRLSIVNYKNFEQSNFNFSKDSVNTIIGENASGKTNVFQAMRIVLDDSLPMNAKCLSKDDFHRGLGEPFGHWIVISIFFDGLGDSEEEHVLSNYILNDDGKSTATGSGTYSFIYRPKAHIRQEMHLLSSRYSDKDERTDAIKKFISKQSITRETYEPVAFVRTKLDFTDQNVYKKIVGDFDNYIFPDPNMEDSTEIGNYKPPYFSIVKEVACTYVKALRNVVADLKYHKTNPLYKLLTLESKHIEDEKDVANDIRKVNEKISSIPEIEALSKSISKSLINTVGSTYSPKINVSSQLPEDFTELIQSLGLIVEDSINYQGTGKIEDLSLGGANLIFLALKLYEYEAIRDNEAHITHFLMIEEPEAHIHNHIQKTLFENFNFKNTQVFVSTHSTQISSASKISSMNILARKESKTEVYFPASGLDEPNAQCIERYLDAVRSDILFAKSVILVEGDAELILIPALVRETLGVSLDEMGISLVKMDGTVFIHISDLFHKTRIKNYCSILTDLDASFITDEDFASDKYVKSQIDAEKSGALRKAKMNEYIKDNEYVEAFYAENTFETELVRYPENVQLFNDVVKTSYTKEAVREKVINNISSKDMPLRYYSTLKFANKIGKGWLATKMIEHVSIQNVVPTYILKAIKFSLSHRNLSEICLKMMDYNISQMEKKEQKKINSKSTFEAKFKAYREFFKNDSFIKFMDI